MSGTNAADIQLNAEERAAIIRAQKNALALAATVGMPPPPAGNPMSGREENEPVSIVTVGKAFVLRASRHVKIAFPVGTYPALSRYADHWWSKVNGLTQVSAEMMRQVLPAELLPAEDKAAVLKQRAEDAVRAAYAAMETAKAAGVAFEVPPVPDSLMDGPDQPTPQQPAAAEPVAPAPPGDPIPSGAELSTTEQPVKPAGFTDDELAALDAALNDPARPPEVTPAEWIEQAPARLAAADGGGGTGAGEDTATATTGKRKK